MASGLAKLIQQVKPGDKIKNALPGAPSGTPDQTHTVTAVHITRTDHAYTDVTIATPAGSRTITGTSNHPYWDATTHTWTPAVSLHAGDRIQTSTAHTLPVTALRSYRATQTTYDLTIDGLHTYYVEAGSTPVLVHNSSPCDDVNLYKAPGAGMTNKLLKDGFTSEDFPGSGNGYPDGRAYFGLNEDGKTISLDYAGRGGYDGSVLQVTVPRADFEQNFAQYVGAHNGVPDTEVAIPNTVFNVLNQYPRSILSS
jgi:Pretoxin HINT domain